MKFCHECGYQLHNEDKFCANCGTKQLVDMHDIPLEQTEVIDTPNIPLEQKMISVVDNENVVEGIQISEKEIEIENPQETISEQESNLSNEVQGFHESDISENMDVSLSSLEIPGVQNGFIRFQWNGADFTLNLKNENFRKLKLPERVEFLKEARIHIEVNDKLITSEEGKSYTDAWYIDIPIESESMTIDVWLSLKGKDKEKPLKYNTLKGALFGKPREVFNITVDLKDSYTLELTEPLEYITVFGLFGYNLKDSEGNVIDGLGTAVNPKQQLYTLLFPPLLFKYLRDETVRNDLILKNSYLIPGVSGLLIYIMFLL